MFFEGGEVDIGESETEEIKEGSLKWDIVVRVGKKVVIKALLHCVNFPATCVNALARQVAEELRSVIGSISQCLLLRNALHEVEFSSTFRNALQQLTTPLHGVTPLQQFFSHFFL